MSLATAQPPEASSLHGLDSFVHIKHLRSTNRVPGAALGQGTHPGTGRAGPWPLGADVLVGGDSL